MECESKSSLVFIDTNIVIELFKNRSLFSKFKQFLLKTDKSVLITDVLCHELSVKKQYLSEYSKILRSIPHKLAIPCDKVLENEIKSYPKKLDRSIVYHEVNNQDEVIERLFLFNVWNKSREQYEKDRLTLIDQVKIFKTGQWENSWQVSCLWILNDIMKIDKKLFEKIRKNHSLLDIEAVPSEWVRANIAYEKYIVEGKEPSDSDLGDFHHIAYIPYCGLVIIENDTCRILNKIKRESHYDEIKDIDFQNLKYIRNL